MFVGEAPGADEDRIGKPLSDAPGNCRQDARGDRLDRSQVYIANVVPWRPPAIARRRSRDGGLPALHAPSIELVDPKILICLGAPRADAARHQRRIMRARGKWLL